MRAGDEAVARYAMPSLRMLGSTGEPWDGESYDWYFKHVGHERCPIINISGGTDIVGCFWRRCPHTDQTRISAEPRVRHGR